MVVPIPAMFGMVNSPSEWALSMRTPLVYLAGMQVWVSFIKVGLLQMFSPNFTVAMLPRGPDISSGFFLFCEGILGLYICREKSVDVSCLPMFAILCLIDGILDLVLEMQHAVDSPLPYIVQTDYLPLASNGELIPSWYYNIVHVFLALGPVSELAAAALGWKMYKDSDQEQFSPLLDAGDQGQDYTAFAGTGRSIGNDAGSNGGNNGSSTSQGEVRQAGGDLSPSRHFKAFEGEGQTLGSQ